MSKRLQVVLSDADLQRYERSARAVGLSLSEWVRQALRAAERENSPADIEAKFSAVAEALKHSYPAPDVAEMLAEIEGGYRAAGG